MKLLLCPKCHDVKALEYREATCRCGASSARYVDDILAEAKGKAFILGIDGPGLTRAINLRRFHHPSDNITVPCWIMGDATPNVTYLGEQK